MKIEIRDESQRLIVSNDELNNENFVDLEIYDDEAITKDNERGFVAEITVSVESLKAAVDAFWQIKLNHNI